MQLNDFHELLANIQTTIDFKFDNETFLLNAFVHRSYLNEHRSFGLPSNERMEFLGDACLELIISEYLYNEYPSEPEGKLTNFRSSIVNTHSLADCARELKLGTFLLLSRGEEAGSGRNSEYILANTFEALLGAIYLDQGYQATATFVYKHLIHKLTDIIENERYRDPKSKLQELTQAKLSETPRYSVIEEWGPDHEKNFRVGVVVGKSQVAEGIGSSKQKAELQAAQNALEQWIPTLK
ncbi:ribonuclease III [candidate division WWE3 bacterium]|nr:ribonuclease III [candidate division WWE3 bacterium]